MSGPAAGADDPWAGAARLWPGGRPATPAAALHGCRVRRGAFRGNASGDPRWVYDGALLVDASTPGADRALLAALAGARAPGAGPAGGAALERLFRDQRGCGHWPVRPVAVHRGRVATLVRFALEDGQAVADADVELARLLDAALGGWDALSWQGLGQPRALCAWKSGREAGLLAVHGGRDPEGCGAPPRLDAGRVLLGADGAEPLRGPPWADPPPAPHGGERAWEAQLARIAAALGAAPDRWRGLAWAAPTRAGVLRFGRDDRCVVGVFDEPLRAAQVPRPLAVGDFMPEEVSPAGLAIRVPMHASGAAFWRSPASLWETLVAQGLPLAPGARPGAAELGSAPAPPLGPRFEEVPVPYEHAYRVFDAARGAPLPGRFRDGMRPADLARRMSAAAAMGGRR